MRDRAPDKTQAAGLQDSENAAWASVEISLPAQHLFEFLSNFERVFRINPYLEIESWHQQTNPAAVPTCQLKALNQINGCRVECSVRVEPVGAGSGYNLVYDRGLKRSTELRIEARGDASLLTITEHYHAVADESDQRLKEVDGSLIPWAAAIRVHLRGRARFGRLPGYRWWTERVMLGMLPRQRRMVRMIVWVSVLEFVVFLFVALIFYLESRPS